MEIDKAIRESDDRRLKTKYENAIYVIQRALALYAIEEVAFSFNGGKDSTVLLHLLRAGYFLYKGEQQSCSKEDIKDFPIRTIYFESPSAFPEINSFTYDMVSKYGFQMDTIRQDFKSGLEALLKTKPIRAIFLGVRIGDPTAVGQEQFSPSSPSWPPFMRVNPILDWSYRDVWAFLLTCKVQYCSLYDQGYTSIGSIYDTVPNALLCISDSSRTKETFKPAYLLSDGRLERAGRAKKFPPVCGTFPAVSNGPDSVDSRKNSMLTASAVAVGDEILFGTVVDQLAPSLCRKIHSIGWSLSQATVVRNDVDSVAEEVERQKSANDMVFIYGGVGPLHSDVTLSGVAKAFGVRLAPDEEFEEYLRHLVGDQCTGDRNEMALLPEGITELLHHEKLRVPLIKCQNVIILSATNAMELDKQWECLIEITGSSGLIPVMEPYVSKCLTTQLSDAMVFKLDKNIEKMKGMNFQTLQRSCVVEIARPVSKLCLDFPDLYIGCYRESRRGPLMMSFKAKDPARIESAIEALHKKLCPGAFSAIN